MVAMDNWKKKCVGFNKTVDNTRLEQIWLQGEHKSPKQLIKSLPTLQIQSASTQNMTTKLNATLKSTRLFILLV